MTLISNTDTGRKAVSGAYYNYKVWPLAGSGAEREEEREYQYQWLHEGEMEVLLPLLEIERLDCSDQCCHQHLKGGGDLIYCVRGPACCKSVPGHHWTGLQVQEKPWP